VVKDFLEHATVATTENYYINTKRGLQQPMLGIFGLNQKFRIRMKLKSKVIAAIH
jgi:hypothetical protein